MFFHGRHGLCQVSKVCVGKLLGFSVRFVTGWMPVLTNNSVRPLRAKQKFLSCKNEWRNEKYGQKGCVAEGMVWRTRICPVAMLSHSCITHSHIFHCPAFSIDSCLCLILLYQNLALGLCLIVAVSLCVCVCVNDLLMSFIVCAVCRWCFVTESHHSLFTVCQCAFLGRLPKVDLIILQGGKCPSVRP